MNIETKNEFYSKVETSLDTFEHIVAYDNAVAAGSQSVILHQSNQSIKTLLATRSFRTLYKSIFYITQDDKKAEEIAEDFCVLNTDQDVFFIPDFETLPYEARSPHYVIRAQRMRAITSLFSEKKAIYCLSLRNLLRTIVPPEHIKENIITYKQGDDHDPADIINFLVNCGYEHSTGIEKVGQYSKRGGILDIFSPNYSEPIRLDFFGDEISSIRHFSIATQRSQKLHLTSVTIIPCREVIISDAIHSSILCEKIITKGYYEGIELDIPLIYPKNKHSILDYVNPEKCLLFLDDFSIDFRIFHDYCTEIDEFYTKAKLANPKRPLPTPDTLITSKKEISFYLKKFNAHYLNTGTMFLGKNDIIVSPIQIHCHCEPSPFFDGDMQILSSHTAFLKEKDYTVYIQNENIAQKNRMTHLLAEASTDVFLTIGVLHKGFIFHDIKLAVFTDHEIFKRVKHKRMDVAFAKGDALIDYDSLKVGDYIVHIEHGIGIYDGIQTLDIGGRKIECLSIQYAGTDRVYVPAWQLRLVAKYVSEEGVAPQIHKLGGKSWDATLQKARSQIELVADDIVALYAERSLRKGVAFAQDTEWQQIMEQSFIYEDTPDQATATMQIKQDMESVVPMERLLCGDVGFGKTEVAIRAALKAVMSGYQVAVLVPTTLLADQHYHVFRERLAQFPVKITMLSRFRTDAQINADLKAIASGGIDIVIGTHRILSDDVKFCKVGLLIIDEEHRFGVKHKEKIRKIKSNVDTLYMSATPIPRTMNMVLSKLKSMSLIQTSPKARLPIRTVIVPYDLDIIKDAVMREIDRGGQIYFVHNRVETIGNIYTALKSILPDVRIVIGHGQLPERELEKVLIDFAEHKYDLLLATTIIESGIDIPNANTMIVNRADMFGLAQLYQIRGRVGRSNKRAYAYLIIPNQINDVARKRLETLIEYESLGTGYQIAMRDLEIRGAGTLLGTKQSGIITSVGFNFYNKLLDQAVKNLLENNPKGLWHDDNEEKEALRKIELGTDFYFSQDYITDEKQKLQIYKRMLDFTTEEDFDELTAELKDRYGDIPEMSLNVIDYFRMRLVAKLLGLKSFMILANTMYIEYHSDSLPPRKMLADLIAFSELPISFDTTAGLKVTFTFDKTTIQNKASKIIFAKKIVSFLKKFG
jgi:transcription-repair coupling factor (superfamily II helicase)